MAIGQVGAGKRLMPSRFRWVFGLMLVPFLVGAVGVGDEAMLLKAAHGLDNSPLDFGAYARSAEGWYIPHHVLWFGLIYVTAHIGEFLHAGPLAIEAAISCQTVMAGLAGIALSYRYLRQRMRMDVPRATFITLAFFAGGYGVFTFCMGGTVESFMVLAIAARMFLAQAQIEERDAWKLAIIDAVLVSLKAYSLIFLVATWPLLRFGGKARAAYAALLGLLLIGLILVKLWLWNSLYVATISDLSVSESLDRFWQQFFSPWTGLLFCLPVLLALLFAGQPDRKGLFWKLAGLCGCAAVFSLYSFFNGDIAGGRYIFPFVVALLPEIAAAISRILDRLPRVSWLLPILVFAFLPVAAFGYPYFPEGTVPERGFCRPEHPVVHSWKIVIAKIANRDHVEICFREQRYALSARDVASPHLGPWRVAYMLDGGHDPAYRAVAHSPEQLRHDLWGEQLSDRLRGVGLGSSWFWSVAGLLPAFLVIWLSIWAAMRINSPQPAARPTQ